MSKTVVLTGDSRVLDVCKLNLQTYVGTEILPVRTPEDFFQLLTIIGQVDVVVVDEKTVIDGASLFYQKLKVRKISVIYLGNGNVGEVGDLVITTGLEVKPIVKAVASLLGVSAKDMISQILPEFYPIAAYYFQYLERSICDVYIRVRKDTGDQYIKRIHSGDIIGPEVIEKYVGSIEETLLYVESSFRLKFTNIISERLINLMNDAGATIEEQTKALDHGTQVAHSEIGNGRLHEATINLARSCIKKIQSNINETPKLMKLLKRLTSQKTSYSFLHCQVLNFVLNFLIHRSDWGNEEQKEKMAFVAFFHDIAFAQDGYDTNKLCQIDGPLDFEQNRLSANEYELVNRHALLATDLINRFPSAPHGSDILIKQHHGTLNGIGFTRAIAANLSPLAALFMIAEDFTKRVLTTPEDQFDQNKIVDEMLLEYGKIKHRKTVEDLKSLSF